VKVSVTTKDVLPDRANVAGEIVKGEPAVVLALIWTELASMFVTVTVRLEEEPIKTVPKSSELSERVSRGAAMLKEAPPEVPPPGEGFTTVMLAVPTPATSVAEMDACSCVLLTNVVERLEPFQRTIEAGTKFVPLTVSVNPPLPATADPGDKLLIAGDGLLIANATGAELNCSNTSRAVTAALPVAAMSGAETVAVS